MKKAIADLKFLQKSKKLQLVFSDGNITELTYEFLRVYSPSAEVRGHRPSQEVIQTGKAEVNIKNVIPVGNYAIQILFDDGHSSGIYSFDYLIELAENQNTLWNEYLLKLKNHNLDRHAPMVINSPSNSCH